MLYFIVNDQHFLSLVARQLFYYIQSNHQILGLIPGQLALLLLFTEWSTFPRLHWSSAGTFLYYIDYYQQFLCLISLRLVILYTKLSTFPQPHSSADGIMLYYIHNDQQFLDLIARRLVISCSIYRMINISSHLLLFNS